MVDFVPGYFMPNYSRIIVHTYAVPIDREL